MDCLAVFDIDGMLTDTNDVDDECFLRAVGDVLCLEPARLDWSNAPHITDSDLVRWLCQTHHGREPTDNEIRQILRTFVRLLAEEMRARPERFTPIAGARGLFDHLREQGWTSSWRASEARCPKGTAVTTTLTAGAPVRSRMSQRAVPLTTRTRALSIWSPTAAIPVVAYADSFRQCQIQTHPGGQARV
jgi:beta-phosphoglucomutase-like phosphatase (HAD superfamily)